MVNDTDRRITDPVKKLNLLVFFLLISIGCVKSQSDGYCIITVFDKDIREPVYLAHITAASLGKYGSELTLLTDTNGKASLPNAFIGQKFMLTISCMGYEKLVDTLTITGHKTYYLKEQQQALNEVVITAQYAPGSPEKAVHRIRAIDRKKIDALGAQNLRDALTNELNIRISQDNILGSGMSLQGISGENVKILIDGVPVTGRQNGNIDLSQINLNTIERIEIVEGPMSVNYGTNALAGTINLITKKSIKKTIEAGVNSYYESIGSYNLNVRTGFHKGKNTLLLSGGRNFFDGWKTGEKISINTKKTVADSSRFMQWKPKEQYFSELQYVYKLKKINLNYRGNFFFEKIYNRGYPRLPYGETAFDDIYQTRRIDNALFASGEIAKNRNIQWMAAYNDYTRTKNTWFKDLTTLQQTLTENSSDQDTSRFGLFNSRGSFSTSNDSTWINYELGYDINIENTLGQRINGQEKLIADYALFASSEINPSRNFILRPGLRYAYNTAYNAPLIPSVNLKYQLKGLSIRGSYARGFRAPSLKELYFFFVDINHNIVGNPQLKAEFSNNYNLSSAYNHTFKKFMFKTEVSFFYNQIDNLITLAQIKGMEYTYINIGQFKTKGIQLNTEWAVQHLKLSAGASYTGRYNQVSETAEVNAFSYSTEFRAGVFYEIRKVNLTLGGFYKYTGKLPSFYVDENNQTQQAFMDPYQTADVSITWNGWKKRINLGLGCKNLFNVQYVRSMVVGTAHNSNTTSSPVSMGRSYCLKIEFNFNH